MKIDVKKLDLCLARSCQNLRDLRDVTSAQTLTRIRRGGEIMPATLGKIAKALKCDPAEIMKDDRE